MSSRILSVESDAGPSVAMILVRLKLKTGTNRFPAANGNFQGKSKKEVRGASGTREVDSVRADIFPLHTVLFPAQTLPLHIFEDRYRRMIRRLLDDGEDFGVSLIEQGQEALGPVARVHRRGTMARIVRVEILADGRMHLLAVGTDRFQILSEDRTSDVLSGEIEILPSVVSEHAADPRLDRLWEELSRLASSNDRRMPPRPDSLVDAVYCAAGLLEIPRHQKQSFLEKDNYSALMEGVIQAFERQKSLDDYVRRSAPSSGSGLS